MATEKKYLVVAATGDCDPCSCYYKRGINGRFLCRTAGFGEDVPYGTITDYDFFGSWVESVCCQSNTENPYGEIDGDDVICHAGDEMHIYRLDDDCSDPDPCACAKSIRSHDEVNLGPCPCECKTQCSIAAGQVHLEWHSNSTGPPSPWPTELGGEIVTDPHELWEYFLHNEFPQEPQVPMSCNHLCGGDDDGGGVVIEPGKGILTVPEEFMKSNNEIQIELSKRAKADKDTDPIAIILESISGHTKVPGHDSPGVVSPASKRPTQPYNGPWKMRDTDNKIKQYYKDDIVTWAGKTYKVIQDVKAKHPSNYPSSFLLIEDKNAEVDGGLF